ncbi:hypothetical protein Q5752_001064 [Cryptotrichosporon argae]
MPARTMSQLEQTSAILGEYMLKGWTLTDLHCDRCRTTPLMREPAASASKEGRARIQFCATCDGGPARPAAPAASAPSSSSSSSPRPPARAAAPPSDPADSISALLLRGHVLLDETCPNIACRGVPLVGHPDRRRKECVNCGTGWVVGEPGPGAEGGAPESPRSRRRRELYESVPAPAEGKAREQDEDEDAIEVEQEVPPAPATTLAVLAPTAPAEPVPAQSTIPTPSAAPLSAPSLSALVATEASLSTVLARLAVSLETTTAHWAGPEDSRYFVDLKLHTEAVRDVVDLLAVVRRAQA